MLVCRNNHSISRPSTDHYSSWRHSPKGHQPGRQGREQNDRHSRQSRQQDHRLRRIRRQQDRRISDRYVRARRSKHGWPTRRDRAVASRLAHEQVESCRRGSPSMKKHRRRKHTISTFFCVVSKSVVNLLMAVHQVNSTRRQAATLLLCPRRSTRRLRALPRPLVMLERVLRALPARLETMLPTLPQVLLVT